MPVKLVPLFSVKEGSLGFYSVDMKLLKLLEPGTALFLICLQVSQACNSVCRSVEFG